MNNQAHEDDTVESLLEPGHRVVLLHPVLRTNPPGPFPPLRNTVPWPAHDDVEIHAEDTNARVVPGTEIDVLLDTEAKVAGLGEVAAAELVLLDLQAALEDLLGLGAADGDVHGDLFVATDAERAHGVARLGGHGRLTRELLEDFRGSRQAITGLANGDVCVTGGDFSERGRRAARSLWGRTDDELLDAELTHGVGGGGLGVGL